MRIIIDGFGGDNAPGEILLGCAQAVEELGVDITVAGDKDKLLAWIEARVAMNELCS